MSLVSLLPLIALAGAAEAAPDSNDGRVIADIRLRADFLEKDGKPETGEAVTARARFGFETPEANGFRFLAEGVVVRHLVDDFYDAMDSSKKAAFPLIADPELEEINRLQISYTGEHGESYVIGRQRLIVDDARYIGNAGWRQNEQTFDAFRHRRALGPVAFDYAYIDQVNRVLGADHPNGEWDLSAHALRAATAIGDGEVSGFMLLMENETVSVLSLQTYAVRYEGGFDLGESPVTYGFEYARQSDYVGNPLEIDLDYVRGDIGTSFGPVNARIGFHRADGDGVRGFQFPIGSGHGYFGLADAFLVTPANGLQDIYGQAQIALPHPDFMRRAYAHLAWHDFDSVNTDADLGREIDFKLVGYLGDHWSVGFKAARFEGLGGGYHDRDKVSIWAGWSY